LTFQTDKEALITALVLSITAPTDAQADDYTKQAAILADTMTPQEVYVCQQIALTLTCSKSSSNDYIKP
tara:strand:- start:971 stop:1177 length:207 start_codon:yes stop_codon:yes gene_type:complete